MEIYHETICGHEYFGIKYSQNHLPIVEETKSNKIDFRKLQRIYEYINNNLKNKDYD